MADVSISQILSTLNNTGLQQKQPALYQALKSLITAAKSNQDAIVISSGNVQSQLNTSLTYGDSSSRANYKPSNPGGNLIFFFETDTETLFVYAGNAWYPVGAVINATYLTATDESVSLPISRQLLPGVDIEFNDSVANKRTVNVQIHPFMLR